MAVNALVDVKQVISVLTAGHAITGQNALDIGKPLTYFGSL
jgi:hypothetical protein